MNLKNATSPNLTLHQQTGDAAEIALCFQEMAPPNAAVFAGPVTDLTADLYPEEHRAIANSVAKRRHEFASGRAFARLALARLGQARVPIPVGAQRRPVWPAGTTGSLSHSHGLCAVIAAQAHQTRALGLDLEWVRDVSESIMSSLSTPAEIARNRHEVPEAELPACLFSIREAVFKAYNPVTDSFLNFKDVEVQLDGRRGAFEARLANPQRPSFLGRRTIHGRFAVVRGFAVSVVAATGG